MVYLANRVFLIGLVSLLSLVSADEFSDGTANYVKVNLPLYDQNEFNGFMYRHGKRYNNYFSLEIYEKKMNWNEPCLYRVLMFHIKDVNESDTFHHIFDVKASCAVSLLALSNVVRIGVPDQESIEFRQKGNRCVSYRWSYDNGEYHTDKTPDYDCEATSHPESEALEPYDAEGLKLSELKPDGQVYWDWFFGFRVYNILDNDKKCLYKVLAVLHANDKYPANQTYKRYKTFKMSCDLDVYTIDRVVKVDDWWIKLAFKLKDGKCYETKPMYDTGLSEVKELEHKLFDCDKFLNPI